MPDLPARSEGAGTPPAQHGRSLATLSWNASTHRLVYGSLLETCLLTVIEFSAKLYKEICLCCGPTEIAS